MLKKSSSLVGDNVAQVEQNAFETAENVGGVVENEQNLVENPTTVVALMDQNDVEMNENDAKLVAALEQVAESFENTFSTDPVDLVFNNDLILRIIFSYVDPARHYRTLNRASNNAIKTLLTSRVCLRFGSLPSATEGIRNYKFVSAQVFTVQRFEIFYHRPGIGARKQISYFISKLAPQRNQLMTIRFELKFKTMEDMITIELLVALLRSLHQTKNLELHLKLENVKILERLNLSNFSVPSVKNLKIFISVKTLDPLQISRFLSKFPNVDTLTAHSFPLRSQILMTPHLWPNLTNLSLELPPNPEHSATLLQKLSTCAQTLTILQLDCVVDLELLNRALEHHKNFLQSLKLSIIGQELVRPKMIRLPNFFPRCKRFELTFPTWKNMEAFGLQFPNFLSKIFPACERFKFDYPVRDNFRYLDTFFPTDKKVVAKLGANLALKSAEIYIPFSATGNRWIKNLGSVFSQLFPNAVLKTNQF